MSNNEQQAPNVFFTIRRNGDVWETDGQLHTRNAKDVVDLMMILMTNAVRLGLSFTDINRSLKPFEKSMQAQIKDIVKAEAKEIRAHLKEQEDERTRTEIQENAKDRSRKAR